MGREGRCPSCESHECMFYIYVLGSTAAAQLIRRNRNLKLCQTKPELFMSLSLLLLALAGSACIECGTCVGWDAEGLCLEGSLGWDMSPPAKSSVCRAAPCCFWYRVSPLRPLPCPCIIGCSVPAPCWDDSPTAPV